MKKIVQTVTFVIKDKDVLVSGCPELEGRKGVVDNDGMAFFWGEGKSFYVANTLTGKLRQLSSEDGYLLVDERDIDFNAIARACRNGFGNAAGKSISYACLNRYDGFKEGICAVSWMLYPDGRYFADSDGFGMEDNDEEEVYAIIDASLEIIHPFRPVKDVQVYLKQLRKGRSAEGGNAAPVTETAKTKRIFNLVIIDESGSMQSIKKEAIDSVNETIQTIRMAQDKHQDQEHFVTVVTFNDYVKHVADCVPVSDVKELTDETYSPSCCTALYDAMGISLNNLRDKVSADDTVLVTVVTDGYENSSQEYSGKAIKALVDELKAKGWVFAYIGANQDVEAVAAQISITNVLNFEATGVGTKVMSAKLGSARARIFDRIADCCFSAVQANEDFFDEDHK